MNFGPASLRTLLETDLPPAASGLVIALSGGADSACLLTAAVQLADPLNLRALHIDHGLQPAAGRFRIASAQLCDALKVPLTIVPVRVDTGGGASIEAAARLARYAAFARQLAAGECLLTAHHREDQAQTVLLQLLRGAGLKGLSAMPRSRPLGKGWHLRPLLDVRQRDLLAFGAANSVHAAADPMNHDERFDRAYLRTTIWPRLEQRWPGAGAALARTARHLAEAQQLLDQSAAADLGRLRDGQALSVRGLRALPQARQANALRLWLRSAAVPPPSTARLHEALRQVFEARADHQPAIHWGEHALRRYRDRLFLTATAPPVLGERRAWCVSSGVAMDLGPALGTLRWGPQSSGLDGARLPATLSIRRRQGGESLKPRRGAKTMSLQHLCQGLGVLPWMRDALPLLYAGEALIAIGDLWLDARWCVPAGAAGFGCVWEDAPTLL